jgi:hypothetical protein
VTAFLRNAKQNVSLPTESTEPTIACSPKLDVSCEEDDGLCGRTSDHTVNERDSSRHTLLGNRSLAIWRLSQSFPAVHRCQ